MNRENAAKFLPLVQALAEGKVVQFRPTPLDNWKTIEKMDTKTWAPSHFRIKPEPREWWINVYPTENAYAYKEHAKAAKNCGRGGETIRVREIIDDGGAE
jgi:hypothetical protein